MTAFDGAKIHYFKLGEVTSGIDNIDHRVRLHGQAPFFLGGITQTRSFFPSKDVASENDEPFLNLQIESGIG